MEVFVATLALRGIVLASLACSAADAALLVEPWGRDAFRVRLAPGAAAPADLPSALLPLSSSAAAAAASAPGSSSYTNGNLRLDVEGAGDAATHRFSRVSDGAPLLTMLGASFGAPLPLHSLPQAAVAFGVGASTAFGLGQQREACYPEGGAQTRALGGSLFAPGGAYTLDLARGEGGAANSLPWLVGATPGAGASFGLFLNVPAMGQVAFDSLNDTNRTVAWSLAAAAQIDYLVTTVPGAGSSATAFFDIQQNFVSWVGATPTPPDWALGYWHSKDRYSSQADLLAAARGFQNRSVPVDIIVVDCECPNTNTALTARAHMRLNTHPYGPLP